MGVLIVNEKLKQTEAAQATLTLPFELRQKSRLRASLDNGEEVGLMLERGQVLRDGDCLRAENGLVIKLCAAPEPVSVVSCKNRLQLQRACYHLGNRHVPLQINEQSVQYLQDHVLDEMIVSLGLQVEHQSAPFEPETGAYHGHSHGDNHSHHHTHGH
ncbi:urease accessory protein UreE [Kaarinaea lacus]